jgi:hypothetical protein
MKAYWGVDVYIYILFTSALVEIEWPTSRPGRYISKEKGPCTHWIEGWVDPRAGLDDVEKIKSFPSRDFDPTFVQTAASRYTDCAISLPYMHVYTG